MKKTKLLLSAFVVLSSSWLYASDHVAPSGHGSHGGHSGMSPTDAMGELKNGNWRFLEGKMKHNHQDSPRRDEVTKGQHPHSVILSCSDSRVPPEVVFDQGLGDLFVVRSAGHAIEATDIGSIEYAVEHLGTKHIVVMGHESCGAVKATLDTPEGKSTGSPNIDKLVGNLRPGLLGKTFDKDDKTLRKPVEANVNFVAKSLMARSKIIRDAIEKKQLVISKAVYSLNSGRVDFWP